MKKIAVYTQQLTNPEIFDALNTCKADSKSLFFEAVGSKPKEHNFGIFNSTEILSYDGPIVVDFLEGVKFTLNCCNTNDSIYYLYNEKDRDLMGLISASLDKRVVICCVKKDESEVNRKIDLTPMVVNNINDLITTVLKNEQRT